MLCVQYGPCVVLFFPFVWLTYNEQRKTGELCVSGFQVVDVPQLNSLCTKSNRTWHVNFGSDTVTLEFKPVANDIKTNRMETILDTRHPLDTYEDFAKRVYELLSSAPALTTTRLSNQVWTEFPLKFVHMAETVSLFSHPVVVGLKLKPNALETHYAIDTESSTDLRKLKQCRIEVFVPKITPRSQRLAGKNLPRRTRKNATSWTHALLQRLGVQK